MGDVFYIGQIFQYSGDFEFEGAMFCNGRSLNIQNYQALFSIIGTKYGGDGLRTFNIPRIDAVNGIHYLIVTKDAAYPQRE